MAIASHLSRKHDVTIMARNLPGDPESYEWASPWAGAIWLGMADATLAEQEMQLDSLAVLLKLARTNPESSVRQIEMLDLMDHSDISQVWYKDKVPNFRILRKEELPEDAPFGVAYEATILSPMTFLPWLRRQLEATGVRFQRVAVTSLDALSGMDHDILINATGGGPLHLNDVQDKNVEEVRGQTVLVRSKYDKLFVRRAKDYTYAMARGDGTVILGGDKRYNNTDTTVDDVLRDDVSRPNILPEWYSISLTHASRLFGECTKTCLRLSLPLISRTMTSCEILSGSGRSARAVSGWRRKCEEDGTLFTHMVLAEVATSSALASLGGWLGWSTTLNLPIPSLRNCRLVDTIDTKT